MDIYELLDAKPVHVHQNITDFLRQHGRTVTFDEGQHVVDEGDVSDSVFIVLEGSANILKTDAMDNANVIAVAETGTIFGEMGVFLNLKRSASIVARTPLKVLVLNNDDFVNILQRYPDMTFRLLKSLCNRLNHLNEKFIAVVNNKTMIMVGTFIQDQCEEQRKPDFEVYLDIPKLLKRTGLERMHALNALINYKRLNIVYKFSMPTEDLATCLVNMPVLKSYLHSISLARVV